MDFFFQWHRVPLFRDFLASDNFAGHGTGFQTLFELFLFIALERTSTPTVAMSIHLGRSNEADEWDFEGLQCRSVLYIYEGLSLRSGVTPDMGYL